MQADSNSGPRGASWERRLTGTALVAAIALFVPLLVPILTGRVFALDDLAVFHIPLRAIYQEALASGHSILWTPYLFNGFYLHAEGQAGTLHPLHLALYFFLPFVAAFNIELVLSYLWAFGGMWLFLRRAGVGQAGRVTGAMVYAFSGFNLLHLPHMNGVAIVSHIPWLLTAITGLLSDNRRRAAWAFAAIPVLVGSQVLLGYPQYVWISAIACLIYGAVCGPWPGGWPRTALGVVGAALGLGIGAAQLLPTLDLFSESVRVSASPEFLGSFSFHPLNLLQFWSPYVFERRVYAPPDELFIHELGAYNGALSACAVVWTLVRRRRLRVRRLMWFGMALCICGLVVAVGRYGLVYDYFSLIPVIGTFRAPARYLVLVHLGLALLVAITMDDLVRLLNGPPSSRPSALHLRWLAVPAGASLVTTLYVWAISGSGSPESPFSVSGALAGLVLLGVAAQVIRDAATGSRTALLMLPMFTALDLGVYGYSYIWLRPPQTIADVARPAEVPPEAAPGATVHIGNLDARRNLTLLHGFSLFRPYVGLVPVKTLDAETPATQRVAGVAWVHGDTGWTPTVDPMPRARVPAEIRYSDTIAEDIAGIDVSRVALTTERLDHLASPAEARINVVVDEPGRIEVAVAAPAPALLVMTESYHSGWVARANRRELRTVRVYGDHLGVVLEPGEYRLDLRFSPASARYGIGLSLLALLLTCLAGFFLSRAGAAPGVCR